MERIRIRVSGSENGVRCAMVACEEWASHHIVQVDAEGIAGTLSQDFCDVHFTRFMLNELIEVIE
jgi:hypothetical protein